MHRQELQTEFVMRKYPPPRVHLRRLPVGFIGYPCHRKIQAWCHKYCGGSLKKEGDANLHSKLLLDELWLVIHPRFSPTVRQRRLCKPIRQVGICGTRRRNLGRWSYSIPDLWLWILDARTVITFRPPKGARRY